MNEPAWIEHDGSAVCPVPAGHDVERKYDDDKICRGSNPQICNWRYITHYRDWTAFAAKQASSAGEVPNPPAFPVHGGDGLDDPRNRILTGGMTLRDYYAGQVLKWPCNASLLPEEAAGHAYHYADAMLRASIPNIDQHAPAATDGEK